jgi:predicted NAD/FAD-dependent oxidoreductase
MGSAVQSVRVTAEGFEVLTNAQAQRYRQVICALPPFRVAGVLGGASPLQPAVEQIAALRYQPIYAAYLQYPPHVRLSQPMLGLAGGLGQWLFDRGQLCGQAGLITVVISARGAHEKLGHEALTAQLHAELLRELPQLPQPLWSKVIAEQRATFACTPGLSRPAQRTTIPGLYLAGDYTESPYPSTLEAAVRSGVTCARLVLEARAALARTAIAVPANHQ